jgi:hypothetical protein
MTTPIKWRSNGLTRPTFRAEGDGWAAVIEPANGSGYEATFALTGSQGLTWPRAHNGVTGKSADDCKAWVRRTLDAFD